MADYSEFPTTPTAWQEQHAADWETVTPLATEDAVPPPRRPDLAALVPGIAFIVLAITVLTGVDLFLFDNGGLVWLVLVASGVALLVSELRRVRRKH